VDDHGSHGGGSLSCLALLWDSLAPLQEDRCRGGRSLSQADRKQLRLISLESRPQALGSESRRCFHWFWRAASLSQSGRDEVEESQKISLGEAPTFLDDSR
jgi:hypothetical protein